MMTTQLTQRRAEAILMINEVIKTYARPAFLCSFGKDSMALLGVLHELELELRIPVIFLRDPFRPRTNVFASDMIAKYKLTCFDWAPSQALFYKNARTGQVNTLARYMLNGSTIDIPRDVVDLPYDLKRKEWVCGVDWCSQPRAHVVTAAFDCVLIGHKNTDTDPVFGKIPLNTYAVTTEDGLTGVFPLRDWTDEDVWEYIRARKIDVDNRRYNVGKGANHDDIGYNPDWQRACYACMDPKGPAEVDCPKYHRRLINRRGKDFWVDTPLLTGSDYFTPEKPETPTNYPDPVPVPLVDETEELELVGCYD